MAKYNNRFIALDTETGGLIGKGKEALIRVALTEIAMVVVKNEDLSIIDKRSWLIKPYADDLIYEAKAAEISGINKQMCEKEGIDIYDAYIGVKSLLIENKMGSKKPILIFQNKKFDVPFIENLFKLFKDDLYKYIDRVEDTLLWARLKYMEKPKFSLGELAQYAGLDHVQAHRALPDTVTTAEVFIHYLKCLRGEGNSGGGLKTKRFREGFKF